MLSHLNQFKFKLPLIIFSFTAITSLLLGGLAQWALGTAMNKSTRESLTHFASHKSDSLTSLFAEIDFDLLILSKNPFTISSIAEFDSAFTSLGATATEDLQQRYIEENPNPLGSKHLLNISPTGDQYDLIHASVHDYFKLLVEQKGYYDVFLINTEGDIVYSVFKELDFATNLVFEEYASSGLGRSFSAAMSSSAGETAFESFSPYAPSYMAPAAFLSTPLFDKDGHKIGVLAVQLPVDRINQSLLADEWLGPAGKVLLIDQNLQLHGAWGRTGELELLERVPGTEVSLAASEQLTEFYPDTSGIRGERVSAATSSVSYGGTTWGLVVEGDRDFLYASVQETATNLVIVSIVLAAATCAAGVFMARSFTNPLLEVETALSEISNGNFELSLKASARRDEFGSIGRMAMALIEKLKNAKAQEDREKEASQQQASVVQTLTAGLTKLREGDLTYNICAELPGEYDNLRLNFNKSIETLNHALVFRV